MVRFYDLSAGCIQHHQITRTPGYFEVKSLVHLTKAFKLLE